MLALAGSYAPTVLHGRMRRLRPDQEQGARGYYRMQIVHEGRFEVACGSEHFFADPGDVYVIEPGRAHRWSSHEACHSMLVAFTVIACPLRRYTTKNTALYFDPEGKPQPSSDAIWGAPWPPLLPHELANSIRDSLVTIALTWWRGDEQHFEANRRLDYVLARIARHFRQPSAPTPLDRHHPISRVLDVIHQHYPVLHTAADIAAHIGISVSRMNASYRLAAHETPIRSLRHYRLTETERLLLTTDKTVSNIADQVGFRSNKALHKAWMANHDDPPQRWRERQRR